MRTRKQKIIVALKIIAISFAVLIIALFAFRNELLKQTIAKASFKMTSEYNSTFTIKEASFVGLSGLSFSEIVLAPKNADTLFHIHKMKTSVNLWRLLVGDVQLGTLEIEKGYVQFVKNKTYQFYIKNCLIANKNNAGRILAICKTKSITTVS